MEMRKVQRKFQVKKKTKTKKGRPPLGQLQLNLSKNGAFNLSSIDRSVATTREGQRNYERVAKIIESNKENSNEPVCVFLRVWCVVYSLFFFFFLCVIVVFCLFVV